MELAIEDFIISEEALQRIQSEDLVSEYLEEGKPLQELFGFSNEATAEFYLVANQLIEDERYEDAVKAFIFLTTINPYISEFWSGLGLAKQKCNLHEEALFAFSVAFRLEGRNILPYLLAIHCCVDAKEFDRALEIVDEAEEYANEHKGEELMDQFKKDVSAAREFVHLQRARR